MIRKTDIEVGGTYLLHEYFAGGLIENRVVRVTKLSHSESSWYDDHQGGGGTVIGAVKFEYVYTRAKREGLTGEYSEAIEYAEDNWDRATTEERKIATERSKKVRQWEKEREREYWQNKMDSDN